MSTATAMERMAAATAIAFARNGQTRNDSAPMARSSRSAGFKGDTVIRSTPGHSNQNLA